MMKILAVITVLFSCLLFTAQTDTTSNAKKNWSNFKSKVKAKVAELDEELEERKAYSDKNKGKDKKEKESTAKVKKTKVKGIESENVQLMTEQFSSGEYITYRYSDYASGEWLLDNSFQTQITIEKDAEGMIKKAVFDRGEYYGKTKTIRAFVQDYDAAQGNRDTVYRNTHLLGLVKDLAKGDYFVFIEGGILQFDYSRSGSLLFVEPEYFYGTTPPSDIFAMKDVLKEYREVISEGYNEAEAQLNKLVEEKESKKTFEYARTSTFQDVFAKRSVIKDKKTGKFGLADHKTDEVCVPAIYDDLKITWDDKVIAIKDGKYGVVSNQNKEIVPFKYTKVGVSKSEKYFFAYEGDKIGLIDFDGKVLINPIYEEVHFAEQLADGKTEVIKAKKGGKYGFIDWNEKTIVPFNYAATTGVLAGDLVKVKKDGKFGYYSIPLKKESNWYSKCNNYFHGGKTCIVKDGKMGFINFDLKEEILPDMPAYDWIFYLSDDYIKVKKDGKLGIATPSGKEVLPTIFHGVGEISEGITKIMFTNSDEEDFYAYYKFGHGFITEMIYSDMLDFKYGKGKVEYEGYIGICDKNGWIKWNNDMVTPPISDPSITYNKWKEDYDLWINFNGNLEDHNIVTEGAMCAQKNGKYGVIEIKPDGTPGKVILPFEYAYICKAGPNHFAVQEEHHQAKLFNFRTGEYVFDRIYSSINYLRGNCFEVDNGDKSAMYNLSMGKFVTDFEYRYISYHGKEIEGFKGDTGYELNTSGKVLGSKEYDFDKDKPSSSSNSYSSNNYSNSSSSAGGSSNSGSSSSSSSSSNKGDGYGGSVIVKNDTGEKLYVWFKSGGGWVNNGSTKTANCFKGQKVYVGTSSSSSSKKQLFEVTPDMCGKTIKLSNYR